MTTNEKYMRNGHEAERRRPDNQDVFTHHLNCIGDIAGTMADYTDESRFFTPDGLVRGSEAVRKLFVKLFEEFAKRGCLRDAPARGRRRHGLHRVEGRDGGQPL